MINGDLSQFLDTGWYTEATLYYHGYVYWFEGYTDFGNGISTSFVDSWRAKCWDNRLYHELHTVDGDLIGYERVFEASDRDMEQLEKYLLHTPLFEGKSFWDVEKGLVWVEEGEPLVVSKGLLSTDRKLKD